MIIFSFLYYVLATPDSNNIAALKCYEKAGCKRITPSSDTGEIWMLRDNILEELKIREPIFHHPEKFGKTKQAIEAQMCDEFWEVGASGNPYFRQEVVETLLRNF